MKLILSTILGGLTLFLVGMLLFGIIYDKIYGGPSPVLWAIALGCLTQALFMSIIYPHGYKGGSALTEGFKFGLWIGFLLSIPMFFFSLADPGHMAIKAIFVWVLFVGINTLLAGIVIGLVQGRKTETPAVP